MRYFPMFCTPLPYTYMSALISKLQINCSTTPETASLPCKKVQVCEAAGWVRVGMEGKACRGVSIYLNICCLMILCWLQAMMANHSHSHDHAPSRKDSEPDDHDVNIWRGLVAMLGVVFFYFTEKCLTLIAECRKKRQRKTQVRSYCRVV